ncbi:MAG: aquaporin, partial [Caldiserica bacterium]|nr:aquaporin [Caldisericota bacterium]
GLIAAGLPNVWCTGPGSVFGQTFWGTANAAATGTPYSLVNACIAEIFGTAVLLWGILASGDAKNMGLKDNLGVLIVGGTVLAVGLSLGGPSGYSINPARDLGPRILGTLVGTKGLWASNFYWLLAPVLMPLVGGLVGVFTYDAFITPNLPEKK